MLYHLSVQFLSDGYFASNLFSYTSKASTKQVDEITPFATTKDD
jgi:hypothetical protein